MQASAIEALLTELRCAVDELRDDLRLALRILVSSEDRREASALLPAAYEVMGGRIWPLRDLVDTARTAGAESLLEHLDSLRDDDGGLRACGRLLARIAGSTHRGLRLREVGYERAGALYVIERVSSTQKPAPALAGAGPDSHHLGSDTKRGE